jgi:hypothetical protein
VIIHAAKLIAIVIITSAFLAIGETVIAQKASHASELEYIVLPGVFRAPETGFGAGLGLFILSPPPQGSRGSQGDAFKIGAIYTEKKQFVMRTLMEKYVNDHRDHLSFSANAQKYPDSFFGVDGNTQVKDEEKYTSYAWDAQLRYLHEFASTLYIGGQGVLYNERIADLNPRGFLTKKTDQNGQHIYGTEPMRHGGFGILSRIDTRDDLQDPDRGHFIEMGTITRNKLLGSDFDFNTAQIDARGFIPLSDNKRPIRLAWQTVVISHDGNPPFQALAPLGGRDLLRGYFLGRYRDRKLLSSQLEIRIPHGEKWGTALYVGAGNVARNWNMMTLKSFKPAWGAGARYRISSTQKVNIRLDLAWGKLTPNPSAYLSLAEAF